VRRHGQGMVTASGHVLGPGASIALHGYSKPEPAQSSSAAAKPMEQTWDYIDLQGQEQGPHTTLEMRSWHRGGHFDAATKVRRRWLSGAKIFVPLSSCPEITHASYEAAPPPSAPMATAGYVGGVAVPAVAATIPAAVPGVVPGADHTFQGQVAGLNVLTPEEQW
jgi:hypothetical protein